VVVTSALHAEGRGINCRECHFFVFFHTFFDKSRHYIQKQDINAAFPTILSPDLSQGYTETPDLKLEETEARAGVGPDTIEIPLPEQGDSRMSELSVRFLDAVC